MLFSSLTNERYSMKVSKIFNQHTVAVYSIHKILSSWSNVSCTDPSLFYKKGLLSSSLFLFLLLLKILCLDSCLNRLYGATFTSQSCIKLKYKSKYFSYIV